MRRALVLLSVFGAALLGTGLTVATAAAPTTRPRPEIERDVTFGLRAGAFGAVVYVNNNDGDVTATLVIGKGHQVAYYYVPAKVTAERVTARFGAFGELDYAFRPKGKGRAECLGASDTEDEAVLEGTFTFTGEEEYVHIDAPRAEGTMQLYPVPRRCERTPRARRVVRYHPSYGDQGATLNAQTPFLGDGTAREVDIYDGGRQRIGIYAALAERQEGVDIARGVVLAAPASAFGWNLDAGTASLRPPAPFTGSAKFVRHGHDGHGTWTGSLEMPILGGEPVEMAGSAFRAFIHKGTPQDE